MKKYIAEFIGTFVFVAVGCGSTVAANSIFISMGSPLPVAFTTLLIAFAFGLSFVAMAYSVGGLSGCHLNPAVSLAMLITGKIRIKDFLGYIIGQFAGATAAALFLWASFSANDALGQNGYGNSSPLGIGMANAAMVETVMSAIFVFVFLVVTSRKEYKAVAGMVIGLSLTMIHIFGIPFTGTSINPARSFAPAVFVGGDALKQLPVFILSPLAGGIVAALLYILLFGTVKQKSAPEGSEYETLAVTEPETEICESDEFDDRKTENLKSEKETNIEYEDAITEEKTSDTENPEATEEESGGAEKNEVIEESASAEETEDAEEESTAAEETEDVEEKSTTSEETEDAEEESTVAEKAEDTEEDAGESGSKENRVEESKQSEDDKNEKA